MSDSLSKIGMNVLIPIRETLLDIALVLLRPMNLALIPNLSRPKITSRDGTYISNQ